jgi:hypothetical protein
VVVLVHPEGLQPAAHCCGQESLLHPNYLLKNKNLSIKLAENETKNKGKRTRRQENTKNIHI